MLEKSELFLHLAITELRQINSEIFDHFASHAVLAIDKLYDLIRRVADRAVIAHHYIFECLDEPSLNVTSF